MDYKKVISTNTAPKAIGAYSQAIVFENLLFTSGQIPIDPISGDIISEKIEDQIRQVFSNLENILSSEDLSVNNIIKLTVYLTDLSNFDKLNQIFHEVFTNDFPARSVVEVSKLPKNCKVEIEAICHK